MNGVLQTAPAVTVLANGIRIEASPFLQAA